MPCVVADTSPLFYLARLGRLTLLRDLYEKVNIPPTVWHEAMAGGNSFPEILPLLRAGSEEGWLVRHAAPQYVVAPGLAALDAGEREAILLACEMHADLLIIDEQLGRGAAEQLGLEVTGTLGLLVEAKRRGFISSLGEQLERLRRDTTFRFTKDLERQVLLLVGESPRH